LEEVQLGERKVVNVPPEEMEKQRGFINTLEHINSNLQKRPRAFINTYGCQMNENDSERILGMVLEMGYEKAEQAEGSDLIIFNTCCVRGNAEEKVYGHLGALKKLSRENPNLIIAVCGCMTQQKVVQDEIKKKYRHVNLVFGTHNLYRFPELLYRTMNEDTNIIEVWESGGLIAEGVPVRREDNIKAWVTIMLGCNNFCSYCIVPYTRGRERSRTPEDIIKEIEQLASEGIKEITLLGQNVNSYRGEAQNGDQVDFSRLLAMVNEVKGIERIRFMTSHPKDLSTDLIKAVSSLNNVCNQLHLPVQSGSSRVLNEMNRKYDKEHYLGLIEMARKALPDVSLSTDIIVGFPGETEEDFLETLDVIKKARFDMAYTFLYSRRTGTPAATSESQISEEVKKERFDRLLELQNSISREINETLMGKVVEVLCEGWSKNSKEHLTGRTEGNKIVNFRGGEELIGRIVKVRIDNVQTWSLEGEAQ
jgi:tRNA-2-methylthio-N6-dimethylallyladenosine synthase